MLKKLYLGMAAISLLGFGVSAAKGWEIGQGERQFVPQSARTSPGRALTSHSAAQPRTFMVAFRMRRETSWPATLCNGRPCARPDSLVAGPMTSTATINSFRRNMELTRRT